MNRDVFLMLAPVDPTLSSSLTGPLALLRNHKRSLFIVLAVGFLARAIVFLGAESALWADSYAYLRSASMMALQGDYLTHEIYRTPIYPLFISIFLHLFGVTPAAGTALLIAQLFLGLLSTVAVFSIGLILSGGAVATCGAILFTLYPLQLYYETTVLTEPLFTAFLLWSVFWGLLLLQQSRQEQGASRKAFIMVIILFALTTLTRPIAQYLIVAIFFAVVLFAKHRVRTAVQSFVAYLGFFACLLPWMWVNSQAYGFWGLSKDFGLNLYHRVIDVDGLVPPSTASDRKLLSMYHRAKRSPGVTYFTVYYAMQRNKIARVEADDRMKNFALETLKANPGTFLPNSLRRFGLLAVHPRHSIKICRNDSGANICGPLDGKIGRRSFPSTGERLFRPAKIATVRWMSLPIYNYWLISGLALFGMAVLMRRECRTDRALCLLVSTGVIFYFYLITALMNGEEDRFRLPVDGLVMLFVAAALCAGARYAGQRLVKQNQLP